ncbi:MAG: radical SAM protein [Elusimicrobiales bacterium]|nr:radical SAM protein [Elusimicrobiales bacterium]
MARIILISPPYVDLYGKLNRAAGRYFPLGLAYIAAYARRYGGHEVSMYEPEAQGLGYADLARIIEEGRPDIVGLTSSTPNFQRALDIARLARERSSAKVVLGGVHASALPEFILESRPGLIDCVVVGEGEVTFLEVVKAYAAGGDVSGIPGIAYMGPSGAVRTPPRPYLEDLDSIPFPARDLIPQSLFVPNLHNARYKDCFTILTSRGCPFNCSFCASRIVSGRKYRMHSAEYVLEEMRMLKKDYNARQLLITDDTFTVNHERLEKICRGMIDGRMGLKWFCFSQTSAVNRDILRMMARAGCYNIGFGIESANQKSLREIGKPLNLAKALDSVHEANKAGMKTQAFYVFGIPGETAADVENTISFSKKVNSTLAFFNMLVPYPGTRDFDKYFSGVPLGEITWSDFVAVGEKCVLKDSSLPAEEIRRLMSKAYRQYYFNPRRALNILLQVRTLRELLSYAMGGLSLAMQVLRWSKKSGSSPPRTRT